MALSTVLPVSADQGEAAAAEPHPGEALYNENCAACHDKPFYKAPSRFFISQLTTSSLVRVMGEGVMQSQASALDADQRLAVAEYLTGKSLADEPEMIVPPVCDAEHQFDASQPPVSVGWGVDLHNTRFQTAAAGGLTADNVDELEVKWVFAYPGAMQARSEPVFGGGAVYVGSQDGTVWALDAETGCMRWKFSATAEVRTGVVITQWSADDDDVDPMIYFGDTIANTYALRAKTGELVWKIKGDGHRDATSTGTPTLHDGTLFIPVSSLEVVSAANPTYKCCSFRGAVLAVDAKTGEEVWKSYTVDETPAPVGKNAIGVDILAPSGAPVWNSPTVDATRGLVYVGTGQSYTSPADGNSDAIMAFDMKTGEKRWVSQQLAHDAWNVACYRSFGGGAIPNVNCPEEDGPDFDFGAGTALVTLESGKQVVVGGQKSGDAVGVDPDTGETLWKTRVGRGGTQGGVHFGMAADGGTLYVPINDKPFPDDHRYEYSKMDPNPGVFALNAANGEYLWSSPAPDDVCGDLPFCDPGVSQAITAIPGAVIVGYMDGRVRIHAKDSGEVIWERNMLGEYESVSGETATGGAFSGGGVLVANNQLYINAGYGYNFHIPGNALVVMGLRDTPDSD
ncbi:putative PQQ-dependent polyvinyl alcohol dehydrogenase [Luminiphilus syltensis NOR5-1B]|uniref:Putative PQQ-dependent polyvinyl alcohol dehydrogenase n=2 Tax=Luminiphilus TaxID=1341118 RepID=B8KW87_9GAMM|nr:putative PQQ-dependent polyvinyl alcohol dehydrogenase [Luminiphilus syltensis NOR5-1B]